MSAPPVYKLEQDLCRCCHAEGSFFNLDQSVYNLGQKEVYSDMLRNSLNVEILPMAADLNMMTYTICGDCVVRLRDAHYFKHQVTECEQRFKQMYENMVIQCPTVIIEIKEENPGTNDEGDVKSEPDASDDDRFQHRFNNSEDDIDIKEPKEEPKKAKPKAAKSRIRKPPVKKSQSPTPSGEPSAEEPPVEDPDEDEAKKKGLKFQQYGVEKNGKYNCIFCSKTYKLRYACRRHYLSVHLKMNRKVKRETRICKICKTEVLYTELTKHLQETHNIQPPTCNICQKSYKYEISLLNHQRSVHMKERLRECKICGKKFYNTFYLNRHMTVHKGKTLKCEICNKEFRWKHNLALHMNIHKGVKKFSCNVCPNAFVQKASLNWHMKKHHPEVQF